MSSEIFQDTARRTLGRSGLTVAPYIFGAAPLGNLFTPISDEQAFATVDAAWNSGFRCFDVAPHYGLGLAEERLGHALAGRPRDEYLISTKVGRVIEHGPSVRSDVRNGFAIRTDRRRRLDYSRDGVLRSIEDSLSRLKSDRLDLVLVHDPEARMREALEGAFPALDDLRRQGLIAAYGPAANSTQVLVEAIRETDADVTLTATRFSLLEDDATELLLPLARRRRISVIAAGVLEQGRLARDMAPRRVRELCGRYGTDSLCAALAFPLRHPAVTTVALGMRSPKEVQINVEAMEHPPPDAFWDSLASATANTPDS